jgi:hypothetical protein
MTICTQVGFDEGWEALLRNTGFLTTLPRYLIVSQNIGIDSNLFLIRNRLNVGKYK